MKIFIVNNFHPYKVLGGSEVQCSLLAKYLPAKYVAISEMAANKFEQLWIFYKTCKAERPDIVYIRYFRFLFFLTIILKILKIPMVFNTSHINDCKPNMGGSLRIKLQRWLNYETAKRIPVITINNSHNKFYKGETIYNSMEDNYQPTTKKKQVVWINNIKTRKNPLAFLRLVNNKYDFIMIGDLVYKGFEEAIKESGVKYLGKLPVEEVDKILMESAVMVNTCDEEGFGNNFIQAWFNKCPTITLYFDPDNIIKNNHIGFHSMTEEQMNIDLEELMTNDKLREDMGNRAREYALKNHSIINVQQYKKKFQQIIEQG